MIILGLGSNLGDRLTHLRTALQAIRQLPDVIVRRVSPIYISDALLPENASKEWDRSYLNLALSCETSLAPHDLLGKLKQIEWRIGRKPEIRHWGPRIIDIDILAWKDTILHDDALTVPHEGLQERPFALWPLADIAPLWKFPLPGKNQGKTAAQIVEAWGSRFSGEAPFHTKQIQQRIDTPALVGIINITPDSFSDGGQWITTDKIKEQAIHLVNAGAEILDLGAESTAPHAQALDVTTEWQRLEPALAMLRDIKETFLLEPKISLDTRHADIAQRALDYDIDWINDVSGLQDPAMREIVAQSKKECVVMHHVSIPASREYVLPRDEDNIKLVYDWMSSQLAVFEKAGIAREKIIVDPGIGFGKASEHSLELIKQIHLFHSLGVRTLVGHSRKSFLSLFTSLPSFDRDLETTAIAIHLMNQSIHYLRVHNVEMCSRAFKIMNAIQPV